MANNLGLDPFPDPVGHFGAPWRLFATVREKADGKGHYARIMTRRLCAHNDKDIMRAYYKFCNCDYSNNSTIHESFVTQKFLDKKGFSVLNILTLDSKKFWIRRYCKKCWGLRKGCSKKLGQQKFGFQKNFRN